MKKILFVLVLGMLITLSGCNKDEKYLVEFNSMGGTLVDPILVNVGSKINTADYTTYKEGNDFIGWSLTSDGTELIEGLYLPESNVVLYAVWADLLPESSP